MRTAEIATAGQVACRPDPPRSVDPKHKTRPTGHLPHIRPLMDAGSFRPPRPSLTKPIELQLRRPPRGLVTGGEIVANAQGAGVVKGPDPAPEPVRVR